MPAPENDAMMSTGLSDVAALPASAPMLIGGGVGPRQNSMGLGPRQNSMGLGPRSNSMEDITAMQHPKKRRFASSTDDSPGMWPS